MIDCRYTNIGAALAQEQQAEGQRAEGAEDERDGAYFDAELRAAGTFQDPPAVVDSLSKFIPAGC